MRTASNLRPLNGSVTCNDPLDNPIGRDINRTVNEEIIEMADKKKVGVEKSKLANENQANRRDILKAGSAAALLTASGIRISAARAASGSLVLSWAEWGKLDATAMARLLVAGQVSPAEVAAQAAKAVASLDPKLNCVVELFDDVVADPLKDGMNQYGPDSYTPGY